VVSRERGGAGLVQLQRDRGRALSNENLHTAVQSAETKGGLHKIDRKPCSRGGHTSDGRVRWATEKTDRRNREQKKAKRYSHQKGENGRKAPQQKKGGVAGKSPEKKTQKK